MNEYSFETKLAFSQGAAENTHPDTILGMIPGCVKVDKSDIAMDLLGIDFVATLRRGATINIDIKAREAGCSKFWTRLNGTWNPELALEIWSVMPSQFNRGKAGWTLDEAKLTDYTLHVFDHSDSKAAFLMPFQLLRMAFMTCFKDWKKSYRCAVQSSGAWQSQCVFVPANVVIAAVADEITIRQATD